MAWHSILYLIAIAVAVIFAVWKGGSPERIATFASVIATVATVMVLSTSSHRFAAVSLPLVAIDVAVLCVFVLLACWADRYWPIFITGAQGSAVVVHLGRLLHPEILPYGYSIWELATSDVVIIVIILGIYRHWRRVKTSGAEPDWSPRSSHSSSRDGGSHSPS